MGRRVIGEPSDGTIVHMGFDEIAAVLHTSAQNVYQIHRRAMRKIARELYGREIQGGISRDDLPRAHGGAEDARHHARKRNGTNTSAHAQVGADTDASGG